MFLKVSEVPGQWEGHWEGQWGNVPLPTHAPPHPKFNISSEAFILNFVI